MGFKVRRDCGFGVQGCQRDWGFGVQGLVGSGLRA